MSYPIGYSKLCAPLFVKIYCEMAYPDRAFLSGIRFCLIRNAGRIVCPAFTGDVTE